VAGSVTIPRGPTNNTVLQAIAALHERPLVPSQAEQSLVQGAFATEAERGQMWCDDPEHVQYPTAVDIVVAQRYAGAQRANWRAAARAMNHTQASMDTAHEWGTQATHADLYLTGMREARAAGLAAAAAANLSNVAGTSRSGGYMPDPDEGDGAAGPSTSNRPLPYSK
jgi:hypothetical protein